jgi:NTP pyrophosphatase (non-canonical NTP hydrolase)
VTDDATPYRLEDLQAELRRFRDERDWGQFHDPKSLILALVGEVGELAELFQWIPADQAAESFSSGDRKLRAEQEMSDVLIYLLAIANVLDVDLLAAARDKLAASRRRFEVDEFRGVAPSKQ